MREDVKKLTMKMKGINNWIEENPSVTEPNMYEMIDCVTELGIIARKEKIGEKPNKFPEKGSKLAELYGEWNKMYKARVGMEKVNSPEFSVNKNTMLYKYFMDLNMRCCTGEFRYPGMDIDEEKLPEEERKEVLNKRREFLECVKKIGSVSLYINQEKNKNPKFVFDNQVEYDFITETSKKYEEFMPAFSQQVIDEIVDNYIINQQDKKDKSEDDYMI